MESVTTSARNVDELFEELSAKGEFTLSRTALFVAVNDDFRPFDTPLQDGDRVVFMMPVAGG